jgi:hypothetical protein
MSWFDVVCERSVNLSPFDCHSFLGGGFSGVTSYRGYSAFVVVLSRWVNFRPVDSHFLGSGAGLRGRVGADERRRR